MPDGATTHPGGGGGADEPEAPDAVLREALATLKAGYLLVDAAGRPLSPVDPVLQDLGIHDLSRETMARMRGRAVDPDGMPLREDFTPLADAIFADVQMSDVVIGFRLDEAAAATAAALRGSPGAQDDPGTFRWARFNSRRVVVAGAACTLVTAVDVTEMRRAEVQLRAATADLRESERRYRDILENAAEGVWVLDKDDGTVFVNTQMARMLGRSQEEMLGHRLDDFVADDDHAGAAERLERRRRGERFYGEARYRHADGHEVITRISAAPIAAEDGSYNGALGLVTDLTEEFTRRRQLEVAVQAEQRRFQVVFEHIGDVITVFDEAGEVLFGTPSGERILGWPYGYRAPGGVLGLVHPEDLERAAAALTDIIERRRGPTDAIILRVRTAWGEWRYMECVGVNMLEEPLIGGVMVTARDVTDRHQLTLALEHAATHDQLTGLPNRGVFSEHLSAALARAERRESYMALCYLDLDGFKLVNDRHGHATGDLLLMEISHRIREGLRPSDVPSRLGGDEFALILEGVEEEAAMQVAERLCEQLKQPYELAGIPVDCGASIGVALAGPGDTPSTWLARADAALYRAKREGGRIVRLAAPARGSGRLAEDLLDAADERHG